MSWIKKVWGEKQTIFETDHVIVDHLKILPGGFSSVHKHQLLRNCFYVLDDGKFYIDVFVLVDNKPSPEDHVLVSKENNGIVVDPRIFHRFRNAEECQIEVIEVSYLAAIGIEDDIFRVPGFEIGGHSGE